MQPGLNKALHWTGSALALTGIAFVALRLRDYGGQIDCSRFDVTAWSIVGSFALIYGLLNLMLALAWWNLLGYFGANTAKCWAFKIYGISQLARYVPGNIFHLAGRQAMGMAAGVSGWPLAKSSAWELGLISFTGGIFGLLALPLISPAIPVVVGLGLFAVTVAGVVALLRHYLGPLVASALGWYIGFLAISGMLFVGLVDLVSVHTKLPWMSLCGAYVIAWLAGLVTPGAPAGLGVRELVLLFLLKGVVAETDLVLAVVLGRVVTVGGDFGFFLTASLINYGKNARVEL
jgi:uncharacterized membrane protein YbhN (UPF0104 family)